MLQSEGLVSAAPRLGDGLPGGLGLSSPTSLHGLDPLGVGFRGLRRLRGGPGAVALPSANARKAQHDQPDEPGKHLERQGAIAVGADLLLDLLENVDHSGDSALGAATRRAGNYSAGRSAATGGQCRRRMAEAWRRL